MSVAIPAIKDITSGVTAIGDHVISGTYAVQIDKVVIMTMAITLGTSTGGWNEIARLPVTPERGVSTKLALFSDTNLDCNVTTTGVVRAFFSASYTGRHGAFTIVFPVK